MLAIVVDAGGDAARQHECRNDAEHEVEENVHELFVRTISRGDAEDAVTPRSPRLRVK